MACCCCYFFNNIVVRGVTVHKSSPFSMYLGFRVTVRYFFGTAGTTKKCRNLLIIVIYCEKCKHATKGHLTLTVIVKALKYCLVVSKEKSKQK